LAIITNGKKVTPLNPLGVKNLFTITFICCKVGIFL